MAEAFDTIPKGRKMSEQTPIHFHEEVVRSEASSSIDPETTRPIQATTEVITFPWKTQNVCFCAWKLLLCVGKITFYNWHNSEEMSVYHKNSNVKPAFEGDLNLPLLNLLVRPNRHCLLK